MHLRHHVLAIDLNDLVLGRPQRHMQHRPALGGVDLFAREHGIAVRGKPALLRQLQQQLHSLVGNAVLRVVEVNVLERSRQPRAPLGVLLEDFAQVLGRDRLVMGLERFPGGKLCQRGFCSNGGSSAHRFTTFRGRA